MSAPLASNAWTVMGPENAVPAWVAGTFTTTLATTPSSTAAKVWLLAPGTIVKVAVLRARTWPATSLRANEYCMTPVGAGSGTVQVSPDGETAQLPPPDVDSATTVGLTGTWAVLGAAPFTDTTVMAIDAEFGETKCGERCADDAFRGTVIVSDAVATAETGATVGGGFKTAAVSCGATPEPPPQPAAKNSEVATSARRFIVRLS